MDISQKPVSLLYAREEGQGVSETCEALTPRQESERKTRENNLARIIEHWGSLPHDFGKAVHSTRFVNKLLDCSKIYSFDIAQSRLLTVKGDDRDWYPRHIVQAMNWQGSEVSLDESSKSFACQQSHES